MVTIAFILCQAAQVPDGSLTVDAYIESGVPSPGRTWMSADVDTAIKALKALGGGQAALPRRGSPRSGTVFARLVNVDNLGLALDRGMPLNQRLGEALRHLNAVKPMLLLYYDPDAEAQPYGAEALDVMVYSMRVFEVLTKVADEYWASQPEAVRRDPVRAGGMKQVRDGLATTVGGALTTLDEVTQYPAADLGRYVRGLAARLPGIWPLLEPGTRREFDLRLKRTGEKHPDAEVREGVQALRTALAGPAEGDKAPAEARPKGDKPS